MKLRKIETLTFIVVMFLSLLLNCVASAGDRNAETDQETFEQSETPLQQLEGDTGVTAELEGAYEDRASVFGAPLQDYLDWKEMLRDQTGFSFSLMGLWLYQLATESMTDSMDGLGQWYRLNASWTLIGRGTGHSGRIEARMEYRSKIDGYISPARLGSEIGVAAVNPGFGYVDEFPLNLAVLNWTQMLFNDRLGIAVGRLAFDGYLDGSPFQSLTRGFFNRSFGLNPAMATTGIGALGAVIKGDLPGGFWLGAQTHDANAVSGEFNQDVFDHNEWLKAIEIGWTAKDGSYPIDQVRLTYWSKDERKEAGVSSGSGWVFSASLQIGERFLPFIRIGHSDGGAGVAAENSVSGGFELAAFPDQAWSLGLGWSEPSRETFGPDVRNETVLETSYRVQLFNSLSITPDVQIIFNPANNPEESTIWVYGLRVILTL